MEAPRTHAGGAEGVHPFWADPKEEPARMEEMEAHLERYEDSLPQTQQMLFALAKSDNRNIAVFTMNKTRGVEDEDCIRTFWLVVDPKHREAHLKKTKTADEGQLVVVPLNTLENAYLGCRVSNEQGKQVVEIAAFEEANLATVPEFELVRSEEDFWIRSNSLGSPSRVERGYVQMSKGTTRRVDSLSLYGTTMDGDDVRRVFVNEEVA